MSKGSNRRPAAISKSQFDESWDRIFVADAESYTTRNTVGSSSQDGAGSKPRCPPHATVAQLEERRSANAEVGGSSPLGRSLGPIRCTGPDCLVCRVRRDTMIAFAHQIMEPLTHTD
jgi:hypothetical protein